MILSWPGHVEGSPLSGIASSFCTLSIGQTLKNAPEKGPKVYNFFGYRSQIMVAR